MHDPEAYESQFHISKIRVQATSMAFAKYHIRFLNVLFKFYVYVCAFAFLYMHRVSAMPTGARGGYQVQARGTRDCESPNVGAEN